MNSRDIEGKYRHEAQTIDKKLMYRQGKKVRKHRKNEKSEKQKYR